MGASPPTMARVGWGSQLGQWMVVGSVFVKGGKYSHPTTGVRAMMCQAKQAVTFSRPRWVAF